MQMHALTSARQGIPIDLAAADPETQGLSWTFARSNKAIEKLSFIDIAMFFGIKVSGKKKKNAIVALFCSGLYPVTHRPVFGDHPSAIPYQEHILFRICCSPDCSLWTLDSQKTDVCLMLLDHGNLRVQSLKLSSLVYF